MIHQKRSGMMSAAVALATLLGFGGIASANDTPPLVDQLNSVPKVNYPVAAQRNSEEGEFVARVHVMINGKAGEIQVLKSTGYTDLDNAGIETVLGWHYVPAIKDGETVTDWLAVKVDYKLPVAER